MLINAHFGGVVEKIVNFMLQKGLASSKAEAVRIMALEYSKQYPELIRGDEESWEKEYVDEVDAKLSAMHRELIKKGILTEDEFI